MKRKTKAEVTKARADKRILDLANQLFDELKAAGYELVSATGGCKHVDIWNFQHNNGFQVEGINQDWCVRGERNYNDD